MAIVTQSAATQEKQPETPEIGALEKDCLAWELRNSMLVRDLNDIADEVRLGNSTRALEAGEIRKEQREVQQELAKALRQLREKRVEWAARERHRIEQERKAQLGEVIAKMTDARIRVIEHVREAAVALGELYGLNIPATRLLNSAVTPNGEGTAWAHEVAVVSRLASLPDPYSQDDWLNDFQYLPVEIGRHGFTIMIKPVCRLEDK